MTQPQTGRFGAFGGRFVPEALVAALDGTAAPAPTPGVP